MQMFENRLLIVHQQLTQMFKTSGYLEHRDYILFCVRTYFSLVRCFPLEKTNMNLQRYGNNIFSVSYF